jgi:Asp-tRNA(Asn)/Glu-tRNA(Gln) amidotransferase A subunit family amidase
MKRLNELTATEAVRWIAQSKATSEQVVRACLERIAERESVVGAWAYLDPAKALAQARERDRRGSSGALHGVPFGIKDIIDTFDLPTCYGSPIYAGNQPRHDAACVALARAAGGVLMGKTVTTEFANKHPGKTANPHDPSRTPGGSSSGSAAAVADAMVPLAIGTQTTASTIRPASFCGIFGYRPTFGDLSCSGVRQCAGSLDTIGLYARSIEDIALYRDVLLGIPAEPLADDLCPPPRIGFCRTPMWSRLEDYAGALLEQGVRHLARAGAQVKDIDLPPEFEQVEDAHRWISSFEFARNFTYEVLCHEDKLSAALREGRIADGQRCPVERYRQARTWAARCRTLLARLFTDVDILLTPAAAGEAPVGLHSTGSAAFSAIWTTMHVPAVSVPAFTGPNSLPIGAQVIAASGADRQLFEAARWVHRHIA